MLIAHWLINNDSMRTYKSISKGRNRIQSTLYLFLGALELSSGDISFIPDGRSLRGMVWLLPLGVLIVAYYL